MYRLLISVQLTLVLGCCAQTQLDQLQLVDLVRKRLDKVLEDGYPLRRALLIVVEFHESVGKLMPKLALPVVFECEEVVLHIIAGLLTLVGEEVSNLFVVHCRYHSVRNCQFFLDLSTVAESLQVATRKVNAKEAFRSSQLV